MVLKEANSRALAKEKQTKMADAKGETFALFLELARICLSSLTIWELCFRVPYWESAVKLIVSSSHV